MIWYRVSDADGDTERDFYTFEEAKEYYDNLFEGIEDWYHRAGEDSFEPWEEVKEDFAPRILRIEEVL